MTLAFCDAGTGKTARAATGAARPSAGRKQRMVTDGTLDLSCELDAFLRDVEARAYRIALLGIRDRDDALDIVQDAMIRLVRRYAHRPRNEWQPLFYRILQNRIRDAQRHRSLRSRVLSFFAGGDGEQDPIEQAPAPGNGNPLEQASSENAMDALEHALAMLPPRQREAFVLRNLEGMDVAATAAAMRCTQGSVKTHYSRAVHRLRELLSAHIDERVADEVQET